MVPKGSCRRAGPFCFEPLLDNLAQFIELVPGLYTIAASTVILTAYRAWSAAESTKRCADDARIERVVDSGAKGACIHAIPEAARLCGAGASPAFVDGAGEAPALRKPIKEAGRAAVNQSDWTVFRPGHG